MNYYTEPFKRYADFSGRSTRKEYWMFLLFQVLIYLGIYLAAWLNILAHEKLLGVLLFLFYFVYAIAALIPTLAIAVRRLHDTGRSGWWYFINFVPLAGAIIFIVFMCLDSQPGDNKYGPSPKRPTMPAAPEQNAQ